MKTFKDLIQDMDLIPLERLEADLAKWQDELKNARTEKGTANAERVIRELKEKIEAHKQSA